MPQPDVKADLVREIVGKFDINGELDNITTLGNGHINETMLVTMKTSRGLKKYVLQRINTNVFPDAQLVMDNFSVTTNHLRNRLNQSTADIDLHVLRHVLSRNGESLVTHDDGYWRMSNYIERSVSIDQPRSEEELYKASKAFGTFIADMVDVKEPIPDTIADFHNTAKRFSALREAVEKNRMNRLKLVEDEVRFAFLRESIVKGLDNLPIRIVHNDTKVNNVLFDIDSGEALAVIDLDTVMAGLMCYDFGELIRTASSDSAEDEINLELVDVDEKRFGMITRGFLEGVKNIITDAERNSLFDGAVLMTMENGVRFLTDFLDGDKYFRISRPNHNLDRCRAQFALVSSLERKTDLLRRTITKESSR